MKSGIMWLNRYFFSVNPRDLNIWTLIDNLQHLIQLVNGALGFQFRLLPDCWPHNGPDTENQRPAPDL